MPVYISIVPMTGPVSTEGLYQDTLPDLKDQVGLEIHLWNGCTNCQGQKVGGETLPDWMDQGDKHMEGLIP